MIRQILKELKPAEREQLMYAFNQEIAQYIELDGQLFIGVFVEPIQHLEILETAGAWAYGRITR